MRTCWQRAALPHTYRCHCYGLPMCVSNERTVAWEPHRHTLDNWVKVYPLLSTRPFASVLNIPHTALSSREKKKNLRFENIKFGLFFHELQWSGRSTLCSCGWSKGDVGSASPMSRGQFLPSALEIRTPHSPKALAPATGVHIGQMMHKFCQCAFWLERTEGE